MAVQRVPEGSRLQLLLQTGTDEAGKPILRTKSFANLKPDASDQDVYDVAEALAGLQTYPLVAVRRIDTGTLSLVG